MMNVFITLGLFIAFFIIPALCWQEKVEKDEVEHDDKIIVGPKRELYRERPPTSGQNLPAEFFEVEEVDDELPEFYKRGGLEFYKRGGLKP